MHLTAAAEAKAKQNNKPDTGELQCSICKLPCHVRGFIGATCTRQRQQQQHIRATAAAHAAAALQFINMQQFKVPAVQRSHEVCMSAASSAQHAPASASSSSRSSSAVQADAARQFSQCTAK
jgi:hypothetical protein